MHGQQDEVLKRSWQISAQNPDFYSLKLGFNVPQKHIHPSLNLRKRDRGSVFVRNWSGLLREGANLIPLSLLRLRVSQLACLPETSNCCNFEVAPIPKSYRKRFSISNFLVRKFTTQDDLYK
jgi:hypothetical protein